MSLPISSAAPIRLRNDQKDTPTNDGKALNRTLDF